MLKHLPSEDRPRERLMRQGEQSLSNAELLAILLRTGTRDESALTLAQRLLAQESALSKGLMYLGRAGVAELAAIKGIGTAKACGIKAAIELGRRVYAAQEEPDTVIKKAEDAAKLLRSRFKYLKKEVLKAVHLNAKNQVIAIEDISIGGLKALSLKPRDVFAGAVARGSFAIILAHNHPGGDPAPSAEDREVTQRFAEAGRILGIELLDHIILGAETFISMKDSGILK
jgi:DNA repair protein RadC